MTAQCPPEEHLEQLLDDRLEATEDAALARHVENCTECQDRLEQLLSGSVSSSAPLQTDAVVADELLMRLKSAAVAGMKPSSSRASNLRRLGQAMEQRLFPKCRATRCWARSAEAAWG